MSMHSMGVGRPSRVIFLGVDYEISVFLHYGVEVTVLAGKLLIDAQF